MSNSQKWLLGDVKLKITRSPDPEILVFLHVCLVVWMWGIVVAENVLERVVGRRKRKCCEVKGVYFELVGLPNRHSLPDLSPLHIFNTPQTQSMSLEYLQLGVDIESSKTKAPLVRVTTSIEDEEFVDSVQSMVENIG